jgi:hypothetical protein
MKTTTTILSLVLVGIFATSCMTPKPFAAKFKQEQKIGKASSSAKVFLVKKDGEKITGKKLTYSNRFRFLKKINPNEEWVAVDGRKISFGDYDSIQTTKAFKILYEPQQIDTATTTEEEANAGQFYINRLRAGKINLFHYETVDTSISMHSRKRFVHEYIFQKENGKSATVDYTSFADAIKDNRIAFEKFRQLFPANSIPKTDVPGTLKNLIKITDLYNKTNIDSMQASR